MLTKKTALLFRLGVLYSILTSCHSPGHRQETSVHGSDTLPYYTNRDGSKKEYIADNTFIETESDSSSSIYQWITRFAFTQFDHENYNQEILHISDSGRNPLKKHSLNSLPMNWAGMVNFRGRFYPFVHDVPERKQINDSTFVDWDMEGPTPVRILHLSKRDPAFYQLLLEDSQRLDIYIIDSVNDIAIFHYRNFKNYDQPIPDRFRLMINIDRIRHRPIIAETAPHQRVHCKFVGDPIDFPGLLKRGIGRY